MSIVKQVQELEEQINNYRKALDDTKKQLTQARTDLAAQAKLTVEHLESSIPSLEVKVKNKQAEIEALDKEICSKQLANQAEELHWKGHYERMEKALIQDYENKSKALDFQSAELNKATLELSHRAEILNSDMDQRESSIKRMADDLIAREEGLINSKKDMVDQQALFHQEVHSTRATLDKDKAYIKEQKELLVDRNKELKDREHDIFEREKQAEAAIANESLVEAHSLSNEHRAQVLDKRELDINERNVSLQAERKRANKKEEALNDREEKLNQREKNLRELEKI